MSQLLIGIKRKQPRLSDKQAQGADQVFRSIRKRIKAEQKDKCAHCGFEFKGNEVHHRDDDHRNNDDANLAVICQLCHPYHHVGEAARKNGMTVDKEGHIPPKAAALMRVSTSYQDVVTPENLNHLMRVIGIALTDKDEAPIAQQIYSKLVDAQQLAHFSNALYGEDAKISSVKPADIAAGMSHLTQDEYEQRGKFTKNVRLLYHPAYLAQLGRAVKSTLGGMQDPTQWGVVLEKEIKKTRAKWIDEFQAANQRKDEQVKESVDHTDYDNEEDDEDDD